MTNTSSLIWGWLIWAFVIGQAAVMAVFVADRALIDNPHGAEIALAIVCVSGALGLVAEWVWRGRHLRRFQMWER